MWVFGLEFVTSKRLVVLALTFFLSLWCVCCCLLSLLSLLVNFVSNFEFISKVAKAKQLIGKQRERRQGLEKRLRAHGATARRLQRVIERGAVKLGAVAARLGQHVLAQRRSANARKGEMDGPCALFLPK